MNPALCDLGASVNLMPSSMFKKLKKVKMKPTNITLTLSDSKVENPYGIVKDVMVKANQSVFPEDFVILDMKEYHKCSLLLGITFSTTTKARIK